MVFSVSRVAEFIHVGLHFALWSESYTLTRVYASEYQIFTTLPPPLPLCQKAKTQNQTKDARNWP